MGLLDDAIREHLELKRLRGADPGEVAREQREALDPVPRDERAAPGDDVPAAEEVPASPAPSGPTPVSTAAEEHPPVIAQPDGDTDFSNVGQETAELDMQAMLDEEEDTPAAGGSSTGPDVAESAGRVPAGEPPEEDSLEWEVPARSSGEPAAHAADDRHAADDGDSVASAGEQGEAQESSEDVLEETPDFLRDTPEQDRLWFEQRPPRDFDFDR